MDRATYRLENGLIGLVVNPVPEWVINSVIFAFSSPNILIEKDIKVKLKDEAEEEVGLGAGRLRKEAVILAEKLGLGGGPGPSRAHGLVPFPSLASPDSIPKLVSRLRAA